MKTPNPALHLPPKAFGAGELVVIYMSGNDKIFKGTLRPLHDDEVDRAYAIIRDAGQWLLGKGIRQWPESYPRHLYDLRQQRGENYGFFVGKKLVVVFSIVQERVREWAHKTGDKECWWLATIAVAPEFRGQGIGKRVILKAMDIARKKGASELYLGCMHGFLPNYYKDLAFIHLDRKILEYPFGSFDMVLMKCKLSI